MVQTLQLENHGMNQVRGILLIAAGAFALYEGWHLHAGQRSWLAYGLGVVAIALGVWRVMRRPETRLR